MIAYDQGLNEIEKSQHKNNNIRGFYGRTIF